MKSIVLLQICLMNCNVTIIKIDKYIFKKNVCYYISFSFEKLIVNKIKR